MRKTYFEQMRELMENAENWMLFIPDLFDMADKHIERLEAENAKLRELVRDMWRKNLGRMDNPCSWCVMDCAEDDCDFEQRMRELGVEA